MFGIAVVSFAFSCIDWRVMLFNYVCLVILLVAV